MARRKQPKPKAVHQLTAAQFDALFQTEDDCIRYLIARRWPEGVRCPRCGAVVSPELRAILGIGNATNALRILVTASRI